MLRSLCLVFFAFAFGWSLRAQSPSTPDARAASRAAADRYLQAYAKWDLETLRGFLDAQSQWSDPTSAEVGATPGPVVGAEAILQHLRGSTQGLPDLHFDFEERFHSADHCVAIGRLRFTMPAAMLGPNANDASFDLRVVTVVRMVGEKVREHIDYSDFSRWDATIAAARR